MASDAIAQAIPGQTFESASAQGSAEFGTSVDTGAYIASHPVDTANAIHSAAIKTTVGVMEGDRGASSDTINFFGQLVVGLKTGPGLSKELMEAAKKSTVAKLVVRGKAGVATEGANGSPDLRLYDKDVANELETNFSRGGHETTPESRVAAHITQLEREGHGIQRHGPKVSEQQLIERVIEGKDPMTGTTTDGGHGGTHQYAQHATKVKTDAAYSYAEKYIRNSQEFSIETSASPNGRAQVQIPLKDIFGADFRDYVTGISRYGPKNSPAGHGYTSFSDQATMVGRYRQNSSGTWEFVTMFPDP
jgi:hypothetical protein